VTKSKSVAPTQLSSLFFPNAYAEVPYNRREANAKPLRPIVKAKSKQLQGRSPFIIFTCVKHAPRPTMATLRVKFRYLSRERAG
jgi:hypothetical protein